RPFCKYICPLGAFYALFQKVSFLKLRYDQSACVNCGACVNVCRMQVDPTVTPNSTECIRCGECVKACPAGALRFNIIKNGDKR
ncbi:MAG: 4Fe-4S binding protein, partial [Firmicutes bacterium]|nr:4Fe-4S binding protein [Bacillota bacterium]